jgi:ferritin-like metal-binding protein YciE
VNNEQVQELLYQALETEAGGKQIYTKAIECALNPQLKEEWEEYLEQTTTHHETLSQVFRDLGLDAGLETPGRKVVRHHGESLVMAMEMAQEAGNADAAQIVAAECVVMAETKDHQNWTLLNQVAEHASGKMASAIKAAVDKVEDQEDEHLYHTKGWTRELWIKSLGMKAVLPPPEEEKDVRTAIGAARAAQSREDMLKK